MGGHDDDLFSLSILCFRQGVIVNIIIKAYNMYVYTYVWCNTYKASLPLCDLCKLCMCSTFQNELHTKLKRSF